MPSKYQFTRVLNPRPSMGREVGDELRVATTLMSLGRTAYERMGHPESVAIEISDDGRAIHLVQGGDFGIHTNTSKTAAPYYSWRIPVVLRGRFRKGHYRFTEDNIFVLDPNTEVE